MRIEKELLACHLDYSRWATLRVLEAIAKLPPERIAEDRHSSFGGILGTMTHLFQADRAWYHRCLGESHYPAKQEGEVFDFAKLKAEWPTLLANFAAWLRAQDDARLAGTLFWRSFMGEDRTERIDKILLHVVNHASYHRGQLMMLVKQTGGETIGTDLILYPGI